MNNFGLIITSLLFFVIGCTSQVKDTSETRKANHLIKESSPYLLQHAYNPVNWYPWGEEALNAAAAQDKLLIISVGYSACHWCHVMEEESFEDSLVAAYMNEHFINIKVDREERPDIDDIYMTACQLSNNQGCGWPLNAFALADGRPIGAVTYQTKDAWMKLLENLTKLKGEEPEELERYAKQITEGIKLSNQVTFRSGDPEFKVPVLNQYADQVLKIQDEKYGGQKGAPKFPMPGLYDFLLTYHHITNDNESKLAVTRTLDAIAQGGIYDHLGGGFARYSTDEEWHVPHFEKMLYDNGQLISLFSKAYQLSNDPLYESRIRESVDFLKRRLRSPGGGFYSSLDADSEGEEGTYYVWTKAEIDSLLRPNVAKAFCSYYGITGRGNWEKGKNILSIQESLNDIAEKMNIEPEEVQSLIQEGKLKLSEARAKRPSPGLDDKILTAWNGLTIIGLTDAYRALREKEYLEMALDAGYFIIKEMMQDDYRLNRNFKDGESSINAFLDDYAFTILAFIELYELTFDIAWLQHAHGLCDYTIEHFFQPESGMFRYKSDLDPPLIAEKKETSDNVIPGSNSSLARGLHSLGLFYYENDYLQKANQMMHNLEDEILENSMAPYYYNWCRLYIDLVKPPYEIAIVGPESLKLNHDLQSNFLPQAIFLGGTEEGELELLEDKLQEGETFIYVCQNKVCKFPVKDVDKAISLMN